MSMMNDHLGERRFHRCPICVDAAPAPAVRHAPALALWLSAAFAAVAIGFLLVLR